MQSSTSTSIMSLTVLGALPGYNLTTHQGSRKTVLLAATMFEQTDSSVVEWRECSIRACKAYMGYNICASGCTRIDVELGRRPLWTVFDSRIQFGSRFDGLLLRYSTSALTAGRLLCQYRRLCGP